MSGPVSGPVSGTDPAAAQTEGTTSGGSISEAGAGGADTGGGPAQAGRRALTYAVLLCLLGAGLAVFAATRTWGVELTPRPAPLPPIRTVRTGGDLLPWLPALALVGLAAAGAVLATRGLGRRLVGVLLTLVGAGLVAGGGYGGFGPASDEISVGWPVLCAVGGLLATAAGVVTAVRGAGWPVMGARYERAGRGGGQTTVGPAPEAPGRVEGRRTTAAWDALDRGEDPTVN